MIVNKGRIDDYEASITLPKSISERLIGSGALEAGLFLSYYDTGAMFPVAYNATSVDYAVTSVVAATFAGQELHNLEDDVIITFKLDLEVQSNVTCVSWDFTANGENTENSHVDCDSI